MCKNIHSQPPCVTTNYSVDTIKVIAMSVKGDGFCYSKKNQLDC